MYRAGAPADFVFVIAEGAVKSYRDLASGRRRIAAFFFPRDLFGLAEAGQYVNTVQAITPVRAYAISADALTELFHREPDIETQFLCKVVHVLREAQHHNIIVARRDAAGRFAMLLRLLQKQSPANGRKNIALPMSRSDIANYLGLSLEAVSRASRRLERQGIVEFVEPPRGPNHGPSTVRSGGRGRVMPATHAERCVRCLIQINTPSLRPLTRIRALRIP